MRADTPAHVAAAFQQHGMAAATGSSIVRWDEELGVADCFLNTARDELFLLVQLLA